MHPVLENLYAAWTNFTSTVTPKDVLTFLAVALAIILVVPALRKFFTALLTSPQFAIKYVKDKIKSLVTGVIAVSGVIRLTTILVPWLVQNAPQWIQDIVKNDMKVIVLAVLIYIAYNYFEYAKRALKERWEQLLQPTPVSSQPFFGTQVVVQKRPDNSYFMPSVDGKTLGLDVRFVINHAMSFYGMTYASYVFNTITVGMIEYPRNIFNRIFRHYGGLQPQCNLYTSPENFYLGMINTSMACWMSAETGNLDFWNLRLTFNETDTIIIDHVEIFLDHDKKIFVKMEIDGKEVIEQEQPSIMAQCIFAIYTHPQVHWWANGARQLNGLWKSAQEAGDITQWMNMASTYISWIFIGNTAATMAGIISHNMNNGLPFHFSELEQKVAKNSTAHQIGLEIRAQMAAQYPSWTDAQVNSLMASTLYHSSDHYYTTYYMSWASQSKYLMQDNSLLRIALFAPNVYWTRKLLVSERLDDPICKLIYDAALKHDPVFAKTALFIGCAN